MKPYDAPTGSVWEMDSEPAGLGSIFLVLDGHDVTYNGVLYRRALSLTRGMIHSFGEESWMDNDSKRIA